MNEIILLFLELHTVKTSFVDIPKTTATRGIRDIKTGELL